MSRNKRMKCELPVFVVEDHHNLVSCLRKDTILQEEVLPCIYRRIGAKQLAFDNLTLIHFDAHSDMSTPKNLNALDIQKVNTVYESVNIESWITPMLYAGHVNSVVWIKPPWTEDTMSETSQFLVGCDPMSNEICVSSSDNYFLSELSYCSGEKLQNTRTVNMYVRTLKGCGSQTGGNCVLPRQESDKIVSSDCRTSTNNASQCDKDDSLLNTVQCCQNKEKTNCYNDESICDSNGKQSIHCDRKFDGSCEKDHNDKSFEEVVENLAGDLNRLIGEDKKSDYILDIDLDFFSTEDPFISSLSAEQYRLMKQLYAFKPPVDKNSAESIERCVNERRRQISELKLAVESVQKGQANVQLSDEKRNEMFLKFIEESRRQAFLASNNDKQSVTSSADSSQAHSSHIESSERGLIDFEWLHEIGTGVDNCSLPHHKCDWSEIKSLIESVRQVLARLSHPPAGVTIARSSEDGYCPADQVDKIQELVLEMLQSLFGPLDVNLQYQTKFVEF